jgi:niacin transporter
VKKNSALKLSIMGLLIAIGIVIPMFSPFKIVLEPASFTLASHVAIFIAMFVSPDTAAAVAVGTAIGFFLGGFPLVIVARAASHIVFALGGAFYLSKIDKAAITALKLRVFSFIIALVHAACELVAVSFFFFSGAMSDAYYRKGFLLSVLLLVGLGTVVHSMVDFEIAHIVVLALQKQQSFKKIV